ncbi:MAG TPA: helix-turn-helix domain-containing protein [Solirubrobacteraceae bacterium]|nr:helix-turn-helix domain-containing protein [Solirubrobacteraceae bacterium]
MTVKRRYRDSCGIARALDVVGERWTLLIVRELLLGSKRFTDLQAGLGRIGPDMLAARLRELETQGLICRGWLPPPADRTVYELTDRGRALEPVLHALGRWGSAVELDDMPPPLSPDAAVVAMQTMYEPGPPSPRGAIALRLGTHDFELRPEPRRLAAAAGRSAAPQATIETDPGTLAAVLWHGLDLDRALGDGRIRIDGDERLVRSLIDRYR